MKEIIKYFKRESYVKAFENNKKQAKIVLKIYQYTFIFAIIAIGIMITAESYKYRLHSVIIILFMMLFMYKVINIIKEGLYGEKHT